MSGATSDSAWGQWVCDTNKLRRLCHVQRLIMTTCTFRHGIHLTVTLSMASVPLCTFQTFLFVALRRV